jgi:hypothetical protein
MKQESLSYIKKKIFNPFDYESYETWKVYLLGKMTKTHFIERLKDLMNT